MSKTKKSGKKDLVPQLRFPEFREAGEWERNILGGLFENRQEAGFDSLPLLSLTDKDGIIPQEESNRKSNASADKSRYLRVLPGDIAYNTMRMWEGRSAYADREGIISPAYTVCKPTGTANGLFYSYYFKTRQLIEQFRRYSQGLVKDTLNLKYPAFAQIPVLLPRPEEQQKIADCLSSIDALIAGQAEKVDALKTHKKGLMQQLFPREGETVPRLRFPEFRKAGKWPTILAGKIFSNRVERGEPGLPIYSVTMTEGLVPRDSLDRRIDDIADVRANKTVRKGDLAYNMMRMWQGALGVAPEDCMVSPAYIVVKPCGVNPLFFYFQLKLPGTLQTLTAHSRGLTEDRLRLYYEDFAKVPLLNPSLLEQNRIADFLASIDALISRQEERLDALKFHKKGLMQRLFPSPEAMDV
ncbi:MAG: restriction endonuclease subunit S [Alcanivoracaceae bacterium]